MTIHTDQPSPEQTGTWEPDYEAILDCYWGQSGRPELDWINEGAMEGLQAVIAEYRSQQAAQGIVEVRRDSLARIDRFLDVYNEYSPIDTTAVGDAWAEVTGEDLYEISLAAAKDQDR